MNGGKPPSGQIPLEGGTFQFHAGLGPGTLAADLGGGVMLEASDRIHLDRPVKVLKDIPSYIFSAGWGDGPGLLHAGSLIYLR